MFGFLDDFVLVSNHSQLQVLGSEDGQSKTREEKMNRMTVRTTTTKMTHPVGLFLNVRLTVNSVLGFH